MNKKDVLKWVGFGLVLIVALVLSGWSMATLALGFFGLPIWLAVAVSIAFDGAAIYTAILASEYSKTEDSGLSARLSTFGFVGVSAYLNWQHAVLLGLTVPGQVFFLVPPLVAWILFEQFLRFEHRQELRKRGRVAQAMPVLGRLAWMRFPAKTFKAWSSVVLYRLNKTTAAETKTLDDVFEEDKIIVEDKTETKTPVVEKTEDKTPAKTVDKKTVETKTVKTAVAKTRTELAKAYPDIDSLDKDLSINKIVQTLYKSGVEDRMAIRDRVSTIKGEEVSMNTVHRCVNRIKD